jgi:hypothetical protein
VAKRINILSVKPVHGFWQGSALFEGSEALLTSEMDSAAYNEAVARETFVHVIEIVGSRSAAIRDAVATSMLDTYNLLWRQGRSAKLTKPTFAKKLSFERMHSSEPDHPSRLISLQLACRELMANHMLGCVLGWDGTPLFAPTTVSTT